MSEDGRRRVSEAASRRWQGRHRKNPIHAIGVVDTHELAWAAGFFDGEGNVRTNTSPGRKSPDLFLSVAQIDRGVLDRFQAAVLGLGAIRGPLTRRGGGERWKPYWTYRMWRFEAVQAVVAMLWKYLSPIKREQAKAALLRMRGE